jgi:hypothetical protein
LRKSFFGSIQRSTVSTESSQTQNKFVVLTPNSNGPILIGGSRKKHAADLQLSTSRIRDLAEMAAFSSTLLFENFDDKFLNKY